MTTLDPVPPTTEAILDVVAEKVEAVLAGVAQLEVFPYTYDRDPDRLHIGPMAQDVHRIFGIGNGVALETVDYLGLCLAAIKGLHNRSERQQQMINDLTQQVATLSQGVVPQAP